MSEIQTSHWNKTTRTVAAYHPRQAGTVQDPSNQLYVVLDDYQASQIASTNGLTLIFTHGNSFNRTFWEPIIEGIVSQAPLRENIKRIIAIDAVNHGDSAILNATKLGDRAFWPDVSRDILKALETLHVADPVVGIGHSFGGGTLLHAALMAPTRFKATILVEPILFQLEKATEAIAQLTMRRRDRWDTLEQLRASFSKAFHDWEPSQLERYVNHGTFYVPSDSALGYWALKTPKAQEAAVYLARPHPQILELFSQSSQRHYFIFGSQSQVINVENRQKVVRLAKRASCLQVMADAGHLIPMTHPAELVARLRNLLEEVCMASALPPPSKM